MDELYMFDPDTRTWTFINARSKGPAARYLHTAVVVQDAMLVFGGTEKTAGDVWSFSFKKLSWTRLSHVSCSFRCSDSANLTCQGCLQVQKAACVVVLQIGNCCATLVKADAVTGQVACAWLHNMSARKGMSIQFEESSLYVHVCRQLRYQKVVQAACMHTVQLQLQMALASLCTVDAMWMVIFQMLCGILIYTNACGITCLCM